MDTKYFARSLDQLPREYSGMEPSRMTLIYFCISALDLLGTLPEVVDESSSKDLIEWIYSLQITSGSISGFRGTDSAAVGTRMASEFDHPHLTMTYTALLTLIILGDDLSRVDKRGIISSLHKLQKDNGCFVPALTSNECDMRFLYCATAISNILQDFSGINLVKALAYIRSCQSYDGGFSQVPLQESHGGSTYCALATLKLLDVQHVYDLGINFEMVKRWCLMRQQSGFQGRVNKPVDTCYSFWIGASLNLLKSVSLANSEALKSFLDCARTKYGGFGKEIDDFPDVLHSYMGLAGLALFDFVEGLKLNAELNVSESSLQKARNRMNREI